MNIEQQTKILWGIACVALFTAVVLGIAVVYNEGVEKNIYNFIQSLVTSLSKALLTIP